MVDMAININNVKKVAVQNGAEGKLNELKQATEIYLNGKFEQIKEDMIGLEGHIQNFLTSENESFIQEICEGYIKINEDIQNAFTKSLNEEVYNKFKSEIKEIILIYMEASAWWCGSPSHSFQVVACIQQSMLTDLFSFAREIVTELANELQYIHNELEEGLNYIFNYIASQEENEEVIEIINEIKKSNKYIASAKELEKIAFDNNYYFCRQTGSHRIYKHITTNKIVEIPFHTVDVPIGTSFAIQKRIFENSIVK